MMLHRGYQIIIHYTVKGQFFAFNLEKKLHQAEKIYTGTACGACDKYEVCGKLRNQSKIAPGGLSKCENILSHEITLCKWSWLTLVTS